MEFQAFAAHATDLEAESGDHATIDRLATLLDTAGPALPDVTRFVQGRIFPAWSDQTLDIGPKTCYTAIARAAGPNVTPDDIETTLADLGDIGAVAATYDFGTQQSLHAYNTTDTTTLTVTDVTTELTAVANATGDGSHDEKINRLFGLFRRCTSDQARILARLILNEMRIGVGEGTVRDAIATAFDVPVDAVERAIQVSNDCGMVATTARDDGEPGLAAVHLEIGRPIKSMLAQDGSIDDALEAWDTVAVETKYDGARVQLHYDGTDLDIYSRNMQTVTDALPDIVDDATAHLTTPVIIDGEVLAIDDDGTPRPFQDVLRRFRRKHDIESMRDEVALELHAFDCLHADGDDLLDTPLRDRHDTLTTVYPDAATTMTITNDRDTITDHETTALHAGHEGIILKNPDATYTPGRRGRNWLKHKPDVETVDLVVTGAEWGEGRRANWFGTYILGAPTDDGYATVGKVATGLTDEELDTLTTRLEPRIQHETGQTVSLHPELVVEVGYEAIQTSPNYDSGYALRFPRFITVRDDKNPADADDLTRIQRLTNQ